MRSNNKIDIVGIGKKINVRQQKDPSCFCSLDEYLTIARKTIASYASRFRSGLADEMLNNEDAVANIAHAIMMADWDFDGRGDLYGFRKERIKLAIKSYIGRSKRRNQQMLSLDNYLCSKDESGSFSAQVADKSPGPEETVNDREITEKSNSKLFELLNSDVISDQARDYIKQYYFQEKSMAKIAAERGVSRQSVHDLITRSVATLSKIASNDDFFRGIITNE